MIHRIVSCIPKQMTNVVEKLEWLHHVCSTRRPHIVVTPQEFFGGAVMMPHDRDIRREDLLPKLAYICKHFATCMVVGVQERLKDGTNRTAIWFINETGEYLGSVYKFALPRYDHVTTNGFGQVTPEEDLENRFKVFQLYDLHVGAMFCWEVYSDLLWAGLSVIKPDLICSMIKFGPNAWPKVKKINGKQTVVDFGYGKWAERDEGGWIERLHIANLWEVKCPIVCSTNSWNLNPRCMPMAGTISQIDGQAPHDVWYPRKADKLKEIPEKIIVTEINEQAVRGALQHKFAYQQAVGEFPPFSLGRLTMHLKMNRIEDRLLKKGAQITKQPKTKGFF